LISQRLEDPATPARDRGILLALLSYKAGLEDEVLGYKGA
jgi:hypothetical protein